MGATSLNEVQFPKELRPAASPSSTASPTSLNEVQFPKELRPHLEAGKTTSTPSLNEVQFPKELRPLTDLEVRAVPQASMKCSSRRNCDGPLSIARHHAHLRRLRERSALGLPLGHPTPHPTSQIPRRFNVLPQRALPGDPRAPERSHQAISGPSGVIVLVRPT